MIARTLAGRKSIRACCPGLGFTLAVVLATMTFALALGVGPGAATAVEGDEATAGADTVDPADDSPGLGVSADPTVVPLAPDPTETEPTMSTPPAEAPVEVPIAVGESTPTESPAESATAADLIPTAAATGAGADPIDGTDEAVHAAAESTTIEIGSCLPAPGSTDKIDQGGTGVYDCVATITVASVPAAFSEIVLDWTMTADVTPGWTADLRRHDSGGNGLEEGWVPGTLPGMGAIEILGADDDGDGDGSDGRFTYDVHFGVRLRAPSCGGPLAPDLVMIPSVLPTIDGIPGWRRHGELARAVQPLLSVAPPAPQLSRGTTGALDDPANPLRFSHADQLVDAGTLDLTITSGYCGGWTVSISATDFWSGPGGSTFGVGICR